MNIYEQTTLSLIFGTLTTFIICGIVLLYWYFIRYKLNRK